MSKPQANPAPLMRTLIAFALASLLVLWAGLHFIGQARSAQAQDSAAASALHQAQALSVLISSAKKSEANNEAINAALVDSLKQARREGDTFSYVEREAKQLVLSNDPAAGNLPRQLETAEKPKFDQILGLPDLGVAQAAPEQRAEGSPAIAAAPVVVDGGRIGAIEVTHKVPPAPAIPLDQIALVMVLGLIGLCVASGFFFAGSRKALAFFLPLFITGILIGAGERELASSKATQFEQIVSQATSIRDAAVAAGQAQGWTVANIAPVPVVDTSSDKKVTQSSDLRNSLTAIGALAALLGVFVASGAARAVGSALKENTTAYVYVGPALLGMLFLAFFPFFYGFLLSFTDTTLLNQGASWAERWVGFANYGSILNDFKFGGEGSAFNYQNFYWTLGVTILWTVTNVFLGVSIGLGMALLLNIKGLKGQAIFRTLLILPWAIPNYITALTWKGMFHPQFGAINQAIQAFGGQPVQWFDSFGPSFITGLATNAWLSFPFMMVVCLGALQSVDEDMYEAARIDGASPWQQFWHITLPSLRPALLPAIIVSVVWTFNMFNVIYLVSAGQPSGSTEILVTRAYKIAFEEYRYGYAAAYSVVIFLILLIYGVFQIKATAATEANNK